MKLPGFGSYTSGSVASIAFSEATPAVDGNVKRVLSRIFATHNDVTSIADQLSKNDSPSEWTQSLMELGALICIPKNPKCLVCPVQKNCTALANQQVDKYPQQVTKKAPKKIYATGVDDSTSTKPKALGPEEAPTKVDGHECGSFQL